MSASTDAALWYERVVDEAREGRGAWFGETCPHCGGFIPPRDLPMMTPQRAVRRCDCAGREAGATISDLLVRHGLEAVGRGLRVERSVGRGALDA